MSEALRSHPEKVRWIGIAGRPGGRLRRLADDARKAGVALKTLDRARIDHLAGGAVHNGVVAEIADAGYADFDDEIAREDLDLIFVLDGVEDPRNLGAILRVAEAFGAGLVVIPRHDSAGLSAAAVKTSAGASEWVPIAEVTNLARALEEIKEAGFWVYGMAADEGAEPLDRVDFAAKTAIVMGSEGKGIRKNVLAHCDVRVAIPMGGRIASLNVATAAAVAGWEVVRRRRG